MKGKSVMAEKEKSKKAVKDNRSAARQKLKNMDLSEVKVKRIVNLYKKAYPKAFEKGMQAGVKSVTQGYNQVGNPDTNYTIGKTGITKKSIRKNSSAGTSMAYSLGQARQVKKAGPIATGRKAYAKTMNKALGKNRKGGGSGPSAKAK
jgi:hypothetical protein